jgi:hypothetical protein
VPHHTLPQDKDQPGNQTRPVTVRFIMPSLRQVLRLLLLACRSSRSKDLELPVLREELAVLRRRSLIQGSILPPGTVARKVWWQPRTALSAPTPRPASSSKGFSTRAWPSTSPTTASRLQRNWSSRPITLSFSTEAYPGSPEIPSVVGSPKADARRWSSYSQELLLPKKGSRGSSSVLTTTSRSHFISPS